MVGLMKSLQGQLLVASPTLVDPNFFHTVVLLVQHNEEGALGLVLNRPLQTTVQEMWSEVNKPEEGGAWKQGGGEEGGGGGGVEAGGGRGGRVRGGGEPAPGGAVRGAADGGARGRRAG